MHTIFFRIEKPTAQLSTRVESETTVESQTTIESERAIESETTRIQNELFFSETHDLGKRYSLPSSGCLFVLLFYAVIVTYSIFCFWYEILYKSHTNNLL